MKKTEVKLPVHALERSQHSKSKALNEKRLLQLMGFNIVRADIRMRQVFFEHMVALELRPTEFSVLMLLLDNAGINQKQLCHALNVAAPNMAGLLDRLTERGLLLRERGAVDRRAQHLHLTELGHETASRASSIAETMEDDALSVLSKAEQLLLAELLQKIANGKRRHA